MIRFSAMFVIILFLEQNLKAQIDTIQKSNFTLFKKNQVSISFKKSLSSNENEYTSIDYLILKKTSLNGLVASNKYNCFSFEFSEFGKPIVIFDKHTIMSTNDTEINYRSFGSATKTINFKFGFERQKRMLFSTSKTGGLQSTFSVFGILGYSDQRDQYVYSIQKPNDSFEGNFMYLFDENNEKLLPDGERASVFFKIGAGTSFGFDWIATYKKINFLFGLKMDIFNLSGNFLVNSIVKYDPDDFLINYPKRFLIQSNSNLGFRFAVCF